MHGFEQVSRVWGIVTDYGKVETKIIGGSTYREWTPNSIPVVRVDMDEFQPDLRLGGFEHFRLNNAVGLGGGSTGSMFREHVAHQIFRELYIGLRSSYASLGSTVWDVDTWVPMIFIEVYKQKFCKDNAEVIGSETCPNMWEFYGDVGGEWWGDHEEMCQLASCDDTRLEDASDAVAAAPNGAGFRDAVADYIDWDLYYRFHCVSWILGVEDDAIRAGNNIVVLEREDGRLVWAPYSLDYSMQEGIMLPPPGNMAVPTHCQADPSCWAGFIAVCEDIADRFIALDAEQLVDEAEDTLSELDLLRPGDHGYAAGVRAYLTQRKETLHADLERYRYLPDGNGECAEGLELCNDQTCGTAEQCADRRCSTGTSFCEARGHCIAPYEDCPECGPEDPIYCAPAEACVADVDTCAAYCDGGDYVYCPAYGGCVLPWYCPGGGGGDPDGGVAGVGGGWGGGMGGGVGGAVGMPF